MKKIKTYFVTHPNMGDALNVLILEKVFNCTPIRYTPINCKLSGIGSGLGKFCYADKIWLKVLEYITGRIWRHTYVWGTGFIEYRKEQPFFRQNMKFCAVRGELSKERVEKILGRKLNIPTCDGGILASELLDEIPEKKYDIGIIPHIKEQNEKEFNVLTQRFKNSTFIDLLEDPLSVVKTIAECKCIVSSSLHGLIVADSLHVPNIHVKVSNNMLGDGFKFDDYYSGYGLKHVQYRADEIINIEFIENNYKLDKNIIEYKKKQMKECFPYR